MTRKDGGRGSLDFTTEGLNEAPPRVSQDVSSDSQRPRERPHITFSPSTNDVPHSQQRSPPPPPQQSVSPRRPRGNSLRTQLFERHRQQQQQQAPADTINDATTDTSGDYSWATDPSEDELKEGPYQQEDILEEVTPQDIDKSIDGEYKPLFLVRTADTLWIAPLLTQTRNR